MGLLGQSRPPVTAQGTHWSEWITPFLLFLMKGSRRAVGMLGEGQVLEPPLAQLSPGRLLT